MWRAAAATSSVRSPRCVRHATGIDLTPAMIEQARALERAKGLTNVSWRIGDVLPLPFADGAFSIVTVALCLSPLPRPARGPRRDEARLRARRAGARRRHGRLVGSRQGRRAQPDGEAPRSLPRPRHAARRADGSLPLGGPAGAPPHAVSPRVRAGGLLSRSFPRPGDADKIRALFTAALEDDRLGLPVHREQDQIHLAYPIAILVAANTA